MSGDPVPKVIFYLDDLDFFGGDIREFFCDSEDAANTLAREQLHSLNSTEYCLQYWAAGQRAYIKRVA